MTILYDPWANIIEVTEGSEGDVESRVVLPFLHALGWRQKAVRSKVSVSVKVGHGSKPGVADFVVGDPDSPNLGHIVVEAKKPAESLEKAIRQAETYAHYFRAPYLLVTDGKQCLLCLRGAYNKPRLVLQNRVHELSENRAAWLSYLSPVALQQWQSDVRESMPHLAAIDRVAAQAQSTTTRKRTLTAQFLKRWAGTTADRMISELLELQSPWRDQFDAAETVDQYVVCFRQWSVPSEALNNLVMCLVELEAPGMLKSILRKIERLSNPTPPRSADLILEAGDTAFGEENVALQQIGIPMIVPWTRSLDDTFQSYQNEKAHQFADWLNTTDLAQDPLVEQVLKPAMRGDYAAALDALERTSTPSDWSAQRRLARKRLLGALHRLHGDSGRAESHYREAESLARSELRGNLWVKRRLMLDLNSFLEVGAFQTLHEKHDEMLGILAWFSNPVIDSALGDMTDQVLEEGYEQLLDRPTASRSSSRIFEGWRAHLKALFFAFASGDLYAVKAVHRRWAQTMLMLPRPHLSFILPSLWAIDDHDLLQKVIRAQPREAYAIWEERWDTQLLQRPPYPEGLDAQNQHRTILQTIPLMAPYLGDDTVRCLQRELVTGLVELHRREREEPGANRRALTMVQGVNFSSSYAIDALTALTSELSLDAAHLMTLVCAVEDIPFSRFTAWKMLASHEWRPEEQILAEGLIAASVSVTDRFELNDWVDFLRKLSLTYPDAGGIQDRLIDVLTDMENGGDFGILPTQRWYSLLSARWQGAIPFVQEHARTFFTGQVEHLLRATGRESYAIGIDHVIRTLPLLLEHYPEALPAQARTQILLSLVAATDNEHLPLQHKKSVLTTLEHWWPRMSSALQKRMRRVFLQQSTSKTLARANLRESPGPGFAPDARPLQFMRLRLYILMDSPVLADDWELLLNTLTDKEQFHRQEALDTLAFLLSQGRFPREDIYAMLLPLAEGQTYIGGTALYLCLKFPPTSEESWHAVVISRMRKCIAEDKLAAIHATLSAAEQLPIAHEFRGHCLEALTGMKTHPNRAVRNRVAPLLNAG